MIETTPEPSDSHKLADLRLLADGMNLLERDRQKQISRGGDPAEANRTAAQLALTGVLELFQCHQIESGPLIPLLEDLTALTGGAKPSPMLTPTPTQHRRPDAPTIEEIKGRLAAIMEYRQRAGLPRKGAGEWVARHMPAAMRRQLGSPKPVTVDSWLTKWGGARGASPGAGREGYSTCVTFWPRRSRQRQD
jgi:hypothetical protein